MQFAWFNIIGSLGVGLIIITYVLLQIEKLRSTDLLYSLLNGIGAALILVSLWYEYNFPSIIVEIFWLLISLFGIGKYLLRRG